MPWVWPKDIEAAKRGLRGYYGDAFDEGIDRLVVMITRHRNDGIGHPRVQVAVSNEEIAGCAKTLIALSNNAAFNAGVIALTAALLPKSYLSAFPGDVAELQGKIVCQRDKEAI